MSREIIFSENAARPLSVYSQGVRWEHLVFISGQVGVDPATSRSVSDGIQEQTRQALRNLQTALEAAGASLNTVLKTTCFLTVPDDFPAFNAVYREFFPNDPPARSTVVVGLIPPWIVEIEAIATLEA